MLLSCETGQERKCQRDGLDILRHYYNRLFVNTLYPHQKQQGPIRTLDEEIQLLKAGKSVDSVLDPRPPEKVQEEEPFQVYETGVAGTVLIIHVANPQEEEDDDCAAPPLAKKTKRIAWDPMTTMTTIMQHLKFPDTCGDEPPPRSRFVTRMIPLQVTCFPSMEEMKPVLQNLLQIHVLPIGIQVYHLLQTNPSTSLPTFKVEFRKRHCNQVTRNVFIDLVIQSLSTLIQEAGINKLSVGENPNDSQIVNSLYKVDLTRPDYTIMAEICRNICGISVIQNVSQFHNFNLMEVGNSATVVDDDDDDGL